MRHFSSQSSLRLALLAALGYSALACSSDSNHGPPVGAPTVPVVITEGGGAGGSANTGQTGANDGGSTNTAGSLNAFGGVGGAGFPDPSAGSGFPGVAGGIGEPPFGVSGSTSTFGGNSF